ncbi:hypothetical protein BJV77DRAFT_708430 [Russula vinacea]|nr:hypothetical protein BJV77DRAFT_708430 [Russula vinacea]
MKMLPHHWQAHTRDYSYAASHVRVPLCRPCGVLSLFNRTVARASIRSVGLCGSGYTAMTAIPNVLFNRPQCAPFSGLFFPVLSMVGWFSRISLHIFRIHTEGDKYLVVLLRASAVRGTVCFFDPCVVLDVPAKLNSALWLFRARSLSIHVSVNHVGNLRWRT